MNTMKLRCSHCNKLLPDTATVFRKKKRLLDVISGAATAFCGKACSAGYAHAHRSPEAKEKRLESNRKRRGIESKNCVMCGGSFFSRKKRFCSTACWYDYTKVREPTETAAIYEKRAVTNASKSEEQLAEERARKIANLPVTIGGEVLRQWKLKLKRTEDQCEEISKRVKQKWASMSSTEKVEFYKKRTEKWYALPDEERKAITAKISKAHKDRTPERVAEISKKVHLTKKANGTYAKSRQELQIFVKLQALLGLQLKHLYCEHLKYPWEADFYDPNSGTIFEYQGFPSHGPEPFDRTKPEHRKLASKLKKTPGWLPKLTTQIWTKTDPKKRTTAKANSIPFVEWYTLDQFDAWYAEQIAALVSASYFRDGCYKIGDRLLVAHDSKLLGKAIKKEGTIVFYPWDDLVKVARLLNSKGDPIYARKTNVVEVSKKEADLFCDKYHIQNSCRGTKLAVGLRTKDTGELVGLMTFGKPRYNKNYDNELLRLCFSRSVVGGSQKMWKFALDVLQDSSVISYCDNAKFDGSIYTRLGFEKKAPGRSSKHWYNFATGQRISDNLLRQRGFDQLIGNKIGAPYGKGTSNEALMRKHGFVVVLDQGQSVFVNKGTK